MKWSITCSHKKKQMTWMPTLPCTILSGIQKPKEETWENINISSWKSPENCSTKRRNQEEHEQTSLGWKT